MYFSSIKVRLALIFCVIYTVSFLIIFQFTSKRFKDTLEKNLLEQNLQKIIELNGKMSDALKWGNWATIEVTLKSRFKQNPDWLFILVRDNNGETVVSTDEAIAQDSPSSYLPEFDLSFAKVMTLSMDPWEGIQQSIYYQLTTIKGDIVHVDDVVGSAGETIFDTYVQIIRDDEILGSVRAGFSRRSLKKDVRQMQIFLITTEVIALIISVFLVVAVLSNMLKALTELARELSKVSHVDNPNGLLSQLQSMYLGRINVKTYELKELKNASLRFQQQLVLNVKQAAKYAHLEMHARRMEAIAKTTQMLAHDVRKPFSMILMVMQILRDCPDPQDIPKISEKYLPEVQSAITAANDIIDDVMEIDRAQQPKSEPTDPLMVIIKSLKEVSRIHPGTQVAIQYALHHRYMINADKLKLQRVFSNIFANAVQAMKNKGILRIAIQEDIRERMMTFCIENNGVYLPKDELSKVFDAFYTKNKDNGTGLGLAISHRIITAHGGEIWCESSRSQMVVKFYFTIPLSAEHPIHTTAHWLPQNLHEFGNEYNIAAAMKVSTSPVVATGAAPGHLSSEHKIYQYYAQNGKKLKLCILDDELIYQSGLTELIKKSQPLNKTLDVRLAKNREEVMALFATDAPDLLICDIDLGPGALSGFEIVRELRKNGYHQAICIHSNRSLPEDYEASVKAGAQAFLPKPMTLEHLIKFIVDSIPGISA